MNLVDFPPELREALGGEFTLERELRGGMSRVFVARDERLGRRVVVKLLDPELAAGVSVDRFNREIQLAAKLQHPNIVPVLSAGVAGRLPFYVMPFVEGESLRLRLARGSLGVLETVRVLRDIARALSYAHERGVVHRDIKPDNILLTAGAAVVADFGVAKALSSARRPMEGHTHTITHAGTALGTPTYMAPEQASADPNADHRADLYSLGAMAFEMLAGRPPFVADAPQKLFVAHLTEAPPSLATFRADVPERLAELIMQCLRKEAGDRPQSAAAVAAALDDPQVVSGAFATMSTGAIVNPARHRRNRMFATGALVAGVALITVIATRYLAPTSPAASPAPGATSSTPAAAPSLAVLPFVNIGSDSADNYLAEGLSEELTTALSRLPKLRVASRTAAAAAIARHSDVAEVAKSLRVGSLLEGTIQHEGDRLRVTARLVDAEGFTLWSDVLEARVEDLLDVQRTIAGQISTALAPELGLSVTTETPIDSSRAPDPGAYQQYLRGKFYLARRGLSSLTRAIGHFQAAIGRDSGYADAHAGLAAAFAVLPLYGGAGSDTLFQRALESATRAIGLDSSLADAYAARAQAHLGRWEWSQVEADLRRAIARRPDDATSHQWYGELHLLRGRIADAVRELTTAQTLDPMSTVIAGSLTHALGIARRDDEALARGRTAVSLDSSFYLPHLMLGAAYLYTGRPKDAATVLEIARRLEGGSGSLVRGLLGHAYARIGGEDRARQIAAELARSSELRRQGSALAHVYLGLGDTATALDWLERAAERRDPFFTTESLASPLFDSVRGSPRFAAVVRRIGLDVATLSNPRARAGG